MFSDSTVNFVAFQWAGRGFDSAFGNWTKKSRTVCTIKPNFTTQHTILPLLVYIFKASYPPLRVAALSCALFWVHHRSIAHSTVPGLWPGVGFDTTPVEAGTLCTAPHSRWHRSHTHTGIYSWAWSSVHYGRSHHHAHSLFPPYLAERNEQQSHIIEICKNLSSPQFVWSKWRPV